MALDWPEFQEQADPRFGGSGLWEICVAPVDAADWACLLAALPQSMWTCHFELNGCPAPLPARFDSSINRDNNDLLRVDVEGLKLHLHFHGADDIAFNVSLDDLADEKAFRRLERFMAWLADILNKPVAFGELVVPSARDSRAYVDWVRPGAGKA